MASPVCCLCGGSFEPGDVITHVYEDKWVWSPVYQRFLLMPLKLEDGSDEKDMHPICPVKLGAPLAMFGADGSHIDV